MSEQISSQRLISALLNQVLSVVPLFFFPELFEFIIFIFHHIGLDSDLLPQSDSFILDINFCLFFLLLLGCQEVLIVQNIWLPLHVRETKEFLQLLFLRLNFAFLFQSSLKILDPLRHSDFIHVPYKIFLLVIWVLLQPRQVPGLFSGKWIVEAKRLVDSVDWRLWARKQATSLSIDFLLMSLELCISLYRLEAQRPLILGPSERLLTCRLEHRVPCLLNRNLLVRLILFLDVLGLKVLGAYLDVGAESAIVQMLYALVKSLLLVVSIGMAVSHSVELIIRHLLVFKPWFLLQNWCRSSCVLQNTPAYIAHWLVNRVLLWLHLHGGVSWEWRVERVLSFWVWWHISCFSNLLKFSRVHTFNLILLTVERDLVLGLLLHHAQLRFL